MRVAFDAQHGGAIDTGSSKVLQADHLAAGLALVERGDLRTITQRTKPTKALLASCAHGRIALL